MPASIAECWADQKRLEPRSQIHQEPMSGFSRVRLRCRSWAGKGLGFGKSLRSMPNPIHFGTCDDFCMKTSGTASSCVLFLGGLASSAKVIDIRGIMPMFVFQSSWCKGSRRQWMREF